RWPGASPPGASTSSWTSSTPDPRVRAAPRPGDHAGVASAPAPRRRRLGAEPRGEVSVNDAEDIETVKDELSAELMAKPGIIGVGMTARDGEPVIVLHLEASPSEDLLACVRRIAGGHPVAIEIVGSVAPAR